MSMLLNKYEMQGAKGTEIFKGFRFLKEEERPDFNDKSVINHIVTVIEEGSKETLDIKCSEPAPKTLAEYDKVDFINPVFTLTGQGRANSNSTFANILVRGVADKVVKLGS